MAPIDDPDAVCDQRRRSLTPYLKFIRHMDADIDLETRISHVTDDLFADGVGWLADALTDGDVSAGLSVPAWELEADARVRRGVCRLLDADIEVVAHGYRHTSYMETPYETAAEELAVSRARYESALGVQPTGFHVPFMRCSPGTVRAADEQGFEWVVGIDPQPTDSPCAFLQPVSPYDLQLFEQGHSGETVTDRLTRQAETGSLLLCHPNIHAVHGATDAFVAWLDDGSFAKPSAVAAGTTDRPGLLLDCFPPFRVR